MRFWEFMGWLADNGNGGDAIADLVAQGWEPADAELWLASRGADRSFEVRTL